MAIATLFAMSACSDDDSSSTPNNPPAPPVTDLCAGKVAGATCDTGKTCQDESGKLVCKTKPAEPPVTDLCAGKVAGDIVGVHPGVAHRPAGAEALSLDSPGPVHPFLDPGRAFPGSGSLGQLIKLQGGDLHIEVDAVQQGAGELAQVFFYRPLGAPAPA